MFSCTMFIIVSRLIFSGFSYDQTLPALRWVDHVDPDITDMDIFFDRLVVFVHDVLNEDSYLGDHTFLAPGVFIKNDTVLTSFNPFRKLTYSQEELSKVSVVYLKYRTIKRWHINVTYILEFTQINCARQIILDEFENSWHMPEKEPMIHSPVHDLMVVRIGEAVTFMDTRLYDPLSFDRYKEDNKYSHEAGPIMTGIATPADILGSSVKFASLGFKNDLHIWSSCYLRSVQFDIDDNVIENCDEWIPKDWGHFICIRNVDNKFKGVGSGAMLFHDDLLFGVGSFLLSKRSLSVLVFTDVRPYYELMFETCTVRDQSLLSFAEA